MKTRTPRRTRGYTLLEVMVVMTLLSLVFAMSSNLFVTVLKTMYKDMERLNTNSSLRYITAQVAKETLDATEFYIFPSYAKLDGSVTMTSEAVGGDLAQDLNTGDAIDLFYGDCLVIVTRANDNATVSKIKSYKIYYRVVGSYAAEGPLRYIEVNDLGSPAGSGVTTALATLLNGHNLASNPTPSTSKVLAARVRGRTVGASTYGIFSSDVATLTETVSINRSVSINMEIVNGTSATNLLSSSSFNYTISPRR